MKYIKHFTWKEWKKFNKSVQPDNSFQFRKYENLDKRHEMLNWITAFSDPSEYDLVNAKYPASKNLESYDSLTMQEVLLSKYKIILDGYETKWTRRYHAFTKVVNQKNLDKSIKSFNGMVNAFSGGMGDGKTQTKKHKTNYDVLFGKSKSSTALWGKSNSTSLWGNPKKSKSKKSRTKKSNSLSIWNDDKKTSIW